jgi:hypothetical protein
MDGSRESNRCSTGLRTHIERKKKNKKKITDNKIKEVLNSIPSANGTYLLVNNTHRYTLIDKG